jgi:hypothetical protein
LASHLDELRRRDFNLDVKNPNALAAEDQSPIEALEAYRSKQASVRSVLNQLKEVLGQALAHDDH